MANAYKIKQVTLNGSGYFTALRASASTTLVKGIYFSHDDHNTVVTLALTKSGGTTTVLREVTHTADNMTQLLPDTIALESGDQLEVKSTHISSSDVGYMVVNYVESSTSVSAQSIDVLSDVDISTVAPTDGQVLVWDATNSVFEPGDAASGSGTVTSVGITAGTGISSSGGPITSSGNITVGLAADINDLDDVNAGSPSDNDVLSYDNATSKYIPDSRLTTLYTQFRSGSDTNIYADGTTTTEGKLQLSDTGADLKVNITGIEITETSPGDIEMVVATDSTGSTAFTAIHIDGTTTANTADVFIKNGANLKIESSSASANLRFTGSGNVNLSLPTSTGTLALTSELYTDSDADARIAAASIDDLSDVDTSTVAPTDGQALVWDNANSKWEPGTVSGSGGSSPWTTSGSDIYYTTGNVGIGTTSPSQPLHVVGDIKADGGYIDFREAGGGLVHIQTHSGNTQLSIGTLTNPTYRQVAIGHVLNAKSNSVQIGGRDVGGGTSSVAIGDSAMENNTNSSNNIGIGTSVHRFGGGSNAVAIGNSAMYGNGPGTGGNSVAIGYAAMAYGAGANSVGIGYEANRFSGSSNNVAVGYQAAKGVQTTSTFANTVAVGYQAGTALTTGGSNILIGYQAGSTLTTESNKLYIENSNSTTPLIYGEFDNDILRVNGTLQVNDPSSTGYAFPTATGTTGQVLEVDSNGDLAFATPSGGGGILNIATISGQFTVGTADDAGEDNIVAGGFRGANYYLWNNDVFTTANSVATGIGTPGTSTFSSGKGYDIMNGLFYVAQAGTAKFSIGIEFDSTSEVAGETWRFFMWKIGSDEITAIESGTYDSAWAGTLVASLTLTVPSSLQNIVPIHKQSANGSSISEGDYVFITGVFDGTVTSTRNFPCNIVMYST